ncbi:MAG: demethoxyubiquinone hydroxylase family protein [Pseudomonadaceae bacterium]|nr:demethoxyubiquinone hydroxylase family protein [Pseudomonadaceae bacterium]
MKAETLALPAFETLELPAQLRRDLRSDHAGETGAVFIYRGILKNTTCPDVIEFAEEHLATETEHLHILDTWLPATCRSRLLPLWRCSGWLLGMFAARLGCHFTFATIKAVEQFVVAHYEAQIVQTSGALQALLITLQSDEEAHRDDAAARLPSSNPGHALWSVLVKSGSASAVYLARWV